MSNYRLAIKMLCLIGGAMNRIDAIRHQHREQDPERFGSMLIRSQASFDIPGDMEHSRRRQSSVVRVWSAVKHHLWGK